MNFKIIYFLLLVSLFHPELALSQNRVRPIFNVIVKQLNGRTIYLPSRNPNIRRLPIPRQNRVTPLQYKKSLEFPVMGSRGNLSLASRLDRNRALELNSRIIPSDPQVNINHSPNTPKSTRKPLTEEEKQLINDITNPTVEPMSSMQKGSSCLKMPQFQLVELSLIERLRHYFTASAPESDRSLSRPTSWLDLREHTVLEGSRLTGGKCPNIMNVSMAEFHKNEKVRNMLNEIDDKYTEGLSADGIESTSSLSINDKEKRMLDAITQVLSHHVYNGKFHFDQMMAQMDRDVSILDFVVSETVDVAGHEVTDQVVADCRIASQLTALFAEAKGIRAENLSMIYTTDPITSCTGHSFVIYYNGEDEAQVVDSYYGQLNRSSMRKVKGHKNLYQIVTPSGDKKYVTGNLRGWYTAGEWKKRSDYLEKHGTPFSVNIYDY